jgi:hypothetical protein
MFPDSHGRPLADLLAECDRLFSTTKKPTTSREDEIRDILILPAELDVEKVIKHFRVTLAERYFLVLSNIYCRGLFRKKSTRALGNYVSCHSRTLRFLGGERYAQLIKWGIAEGHLVKSPRPPRKGSNSTAFMVNRAVFSLKSQQFYPLTSPNAIKVRRAMSEKSKQPFQLHSSAHRKIAVSVTELSYDYAAAINYVAELPECEGKEHRKRLLPMLLTGAAVWSVDRQGRNYTMPALMPRDLRPFLWHQGKPLHQIDIKSSQPTLHVLLYPSETEEKSRYKDIVEKRDFWEHLNAAAGRPYDLTDPDQKDELKERAFGEVFYAYATKATVKKPRPKPLADAFKREFPELWSEMIARKNERSSSGLARTMQSIEADAVRSVVEALKDKPYPLITIHDAILTTKEGLDDVEAELTRSFAAVQLNPRFTVSKITKT